jgi:GTP-binding protein Era
MSAGTKAGFVALAGRPNAGKSTLLNQVLGAQLSIVTPKAQTTRERVLGILTEPSLGQIVFIDLPGIHRAKPGGINAYMMQEVREGLEGASAIWYLVDPDSGLEHEEPVLELLAARKLPTFLLMNKSDLKRREDRRTASRLLGEEVLRRARDLGIPVQGERLRPLSARTGRGVKELLGETWTLLPEGPWFYPDEEQLSDRPVRFFVAEKIREQLMLCLGQELPYSCAVEIESFQEDARPPRIEAVIHVERDSQKGMVIGKGGAKIKEIGQKARAEIEEFLGEKVFLGLRVDVLKEWTRNAEQLKKLGYNLPPSQRRSAS